MYVTGLLALCILVFFFSHTLLDFSIAYVLAHAFLVSVLISGAVHLYNVVNASSGQRIALSLQISEAVSTTYVRKLTDALINAVELAIRHVNTCLSWQNASKSLKSVAYAYLIMKYYYFLTFGAVQFVVLLAFILLPLYAQNYRQIDDLVYDQVYNAVVFPKIKQATEVVNKYEAIVKKLLQDNQLPMLIAFSGGAAVLLYVFWDWISIQFLTTGMLICHLHCCF
jgi:hypothetical protein